jgi:hypothetical protein
VEGALVHRLQLLWLPRVAGVVEADVVSVRCSPHRIWQALKQSRSALAVRLEQEARRVLPVALVVLEATAHSAPGSLPSAVVVVRAVRSLQQ